MNGRVLAVIIAAIVLVVGGVVAAVALTSGDDDDSAGDDNNGSGSNEASVEEFCEAYDDYTSSFLGIDFSAPEDEQVGAMVEAIKEFAVALDDLGAPDDMPEQARDGMGFFIGWADDLDADDFSTLEDLENFEDELSEEEDAAGEAFFEYADETCGGDPTAPPPELPSDLPTGLPTDLPSDFPTEFPTEFPTDFMSDFPTDFLTEIPSEYLTLLPSDYLSYFPTE